MTQDGNLMMAIVAIVAIVAMVLLGIVYSNAKKKTGAGDSLSNSVKTSVSKQNSFPLERRKSVKKDEVDSEGAPPKIENQLRIPPPDEVRIEAVAPKNASMMRK